MSVIVAAVIAGGVTYLANTRQTAKLNKAILFQVCTGVDLLKAELKKFIVIIPPPNETPAQRAYINNLLASAKVLETPISCTTVTHITTTTTKG